MLGRSGMTMVEPFGVRWHRCTHEGCTHVSHYWTYPRGWGANEPEEAFDCILLADLDTWAVKNVVIEQRLGR